MGVRWSTPRPGHFTPGKDPVHPLRRWAPEAVWVVAENLAHTGFGTSIRPARTDSQSRLGHPGPHLYINTHTHPYNRNQQDALYSINLFQQQASICFEQACCSSSGGSTLYKQQLVKSCVMLTDCWEDWDGTCQQLVDIINRRQCNLLVYVIPIYHDAGSTERYIWLKVNRYRERETWISMSELVQTGAESVSRLA